MRRPQRLAVHQRHSRCSCLRCRRRRPISACPLWCSERALQARPLTTSPSASESTLRLAALGAASATCTGTSLDGRLWGASTMGRWAHTVGVAALQQQQREAQPVPAFRQRGFQLPPVLLPLQLLQLRQCRSTRCIPTQGNASLALSSLISVTSADWSSMRMRRWYPTCRSWAG